MPTTTPETPTGQAATVEQLEEVLAATSGAVAAMAAALPAVQRGAIIRSLHRQAQQAEDIQMPLAAAWLNDLSVQLERLEPELDDSST